MKSLVERIEDAANDVTIRADVREFLAKIARTIRAPGADAHVRFVARVAGREALRVLKDGGDKYRAPT